MYYKEIESKFVKHLTKNGKKSIAEKIFFKNIKNLQVESSKNTHDLLILAVINTIPYFKIRNFKIKKPGLSKRQSIELPDIIRKPNARYSLAIKIITQVTVKKQKNTTEKNQLSTILLESAKKKGIAIAKKNQLHEKVFSGKQFISLYYRF